MEASGQPHAPADLIQHPLDTMLGWPTAGLNILEALAGIERSLGSRAGSLVTLPTDLPRLRSEDEHSGYAGSHPGSHLSYCCTGVLF